jgi:hypothetical protein
MTIDEIRSLLSLENLDLPSGVDVLRIEIDPYFNFEGEESLYVLVVLADGTEIPLPKGWSLQLRRTVHRLLNEHGCELYPYVHYALESELQETAEE